MSIREHPLAWRWTDSQLPDDALAQMQSLEPQEAERLFERSLRLLGRDCLSPQVFPIVTRHSADVPAEVGCVWLREQQPDLSTRVYVTWERDTAIWTTWQVFTAHWDDFCYPLSDDVIVSPESESWALLYHHEQEFHFGRRPAA